MKAQTWLKHHAPALFHKNNAFYTALAVAITLFCVNLNLFSIEAFFYDSLMRLKGTEQVDERIKTVIIDHSNLTNSLAVLKKAQDQKPRSIVFFNKFDPSEIEAEPALASELVSQANELINKGSQILIATDMDLSGEVLPPYPISTLPHAPAIIHKDGTIFAQDKVVRRGLLTVFNEPSAYSFIANPEKSKFEILSSISNVKGAYLYEPADSWHFLIRYPGDTKVNSPVFAKTKIELNESLSGSIILVDSLEKDSPSDFYFTPYSRISYTNPRINIHASIINSLLTESGIYQLPIRYRYALTFMLSLMVVFLSVNLPPLRSTILILAVTGFLFIAALMLFAFFDIWLKVAQPMAAIVSIYYIVMPYRAILEYRRRWEVQEKHDILVQVEELKGNFLSLMSHDLKTPVARIQGLAEHILRQGSLNANQKDEVGQILDSTEALDKFISKILNLTKIESENIKLNPKSKDLNQLIEKCVDQLRFQAKQKKIELDLNLEPLFPIQVDAALIIQVLTNIIDNAIKYGSAGTSVHISTKDLGDNVAIKIADTGPGMDATELKHLFTKFYRGKMSPETTTRGSGLGLYLSKYFIELHNGSISVNSTKGQGSEFFITLPNNLTQ